jgi:hypothetical protein
LAVAEETFSRVSRVTKNTIISSLQQQLEQEREARLKLEQELLQLKQVSEQIQETLAATRTNLTQTSQRK